MSIQENHLKAIADAIREKDGTTAPIPAADFPTRIQAIPSGGLPDNVRTITLTADPPEGGTVAGGGVAQDGMTVTVSAEPEAQYTFARWQENGQTVGENEKYTFPVFADRSLHAVFTSHLYNITVNTTDPALGSLLNAGELTVAGGRITQATQTVETALPQVQVRFVLTRSISRGRIVAVNGENIGTVKNANDSVTTTIPAQDDMTINIVFTMST